MGLTLQQLQTMGATPGVGGSSPSPGSSQNSSSTLPSKGISYQQLQSMGATPNVTAPPPSATSQSQTSSPGVLGSIMGDLGQRYNNAGNILQNSASGKLNPLSGGIQLAGEAGGAVNDVAGDVLQAVPGVKSVEGAVGNVIGKAAQTPIGQGIVGTYQNVTQAHPELTKDIGALGNVLGAATLFTGAGEAKEMASGALSKILGKDSVESIASDIAPNMTAKTAAKTIGQEGTSKSFLTGKITPNISSNLINDAQVVKDNVPGFSKLSTYSDKINATQDAVSNMADSLKSDVIASGKDRIYPFKQLSSAIDNAEEPISLKGTPFEKQIAPIKSAAIKLAQDSGGTISGLFDARKAFDALVNKTYPTLWDKDYAPMKGAIQSVRNTMNQFIEDNLPEGSNFRSRLLDQSKLLNAVDNMAPKAAKELGSTRLGRLAQNHPIISGLLKKTAGGAALAAGGGSLYGAYKGLTGQ